MKNRALINKNTVRFLREKAEVTFEYIHKKTNFSIDKIKNWEDINNPELPTFIQAKKLSEFYNVPFAGLYMKPDDINIKGLPKLKNMRVLYGDDSIDNSALNLAVLDLINARDFLFENKSKYSEEVKIFNPVIKEVSYIYWAKWIRDYFNIDLQTQFSTKSTRQLYLYVRKQIEQRDVLIQSFKGIDIENVRGLSIFFDSLPIIGINDKDRYPAKTFSLIHELVHLLKHESTYCNVFYNLFESNDEEVFCNAVAGEVLAPEDVLRQKLDGNKKEDIKDEFVAELASDFSISREVIIRRLFDLGYIEEEDYNKRAQKYKSEYEQQKEIDKQNRQGQGVKFQPNIILKTIDRVSPSILNMLYIGLNDGTYDKQDFARYLNINHTKVSDLITEVSKWNN